MAPRGRGRPRKGNTRMDAAIEQMKLFGFAEGIVKRKMNELLEVYAGEWVFIESNNYDVLIEAILEETEPTKNEEHCTQAETVVDKSVPEEEKNEVPDSTPEVGSSSCVLSSGRLEDQEKSPELLEVEMEIVSSPVLSMVINPPLVEANPPEKRRRPSYGWISDGDDDHDFIALEPMPRLPAAPSTNIDDHKQKRRKTRWDVKPDDLI